MTRARSHVETNAREPPRHRLNRGWDRPGPRTEWPAPEERRPAVELRKWLYRGGRPNRVARLADRFTAALAARGVGPEYLVTLEVPGRRSGRTVSLPIVVAEVRGERYLVSMLGEGINWVRNRQGGGW